MHLLQHMVENMFQISSPVSDISHHSPARVQVNSKQFSGSNKSHLTLLPCQSCVSISVNEELEMEKVPHPWKIEDWDALEYDHVGGVDGGLD